MGEPLVFLLGAAAGIGIGLARGGSLRGLREAAKGVRARWLALGCLVVQASTVVLPMPGIGGVVLLAAALITLLGIARANGRLPGVPLVALGLLLNLIVVVANVGVPVSAATLERAGVAVSEPLDDRPDAKHVREDDGTRLRLLADRLAVRPLRAVIGYGTVIELAGLFLLLQHLVLGGVPFRREDGNGTAHDVHEARTVPWTSWAE
jgi:hypothetical protein